MSKGWPYYQAVLLRALRGKKQIIVTRSPEDAKRVMAEVRKCAEPLQIKGPLATTVEDYDPSMVRKLRKKGGPMKDEYKVAEIATRVQFAKTMRALRAERNLSQEQMAGILGVSRRQISNVEMAKSATTITRLICICKALGVSADYLIGINVDPK